jgi:phosphoglycolate phosphatase-like HAD superfamily hydrolase
MLLHAAERDGIVFSESFMVGDRTSDIEAGRRARTLLVGNGYDQPFTTHPILSLTA